MRRLAQTSALVPPSAICFYVISLRVHCHFVHTPITWPLIFINTPTHLVNINSSSNFQQSPETPACFGTLRFDLYLLNNRIPLLFHANGYIIFYAVKFLALNKTQDHLSYHLLKRALGIKLKVKMMLMHRSQ